MINCGQRGGRNCTRPVLDSFYTFIFPVLLLCLNTSVSLYLAISPHLCVSPGVSVSLIPPSVYSLHLKFSLKQRHIHIFSHTSHLRFGGTNSNTKTPFLPIPLNMALHEIWVFREPVESRKTGSHALQICVAGAFCNSPTVCSIPGSDNSPMSTQQECKGHWPEDGIFSIKPALQLIFFSFFVVRTLYRDLPS